MLEWAQDGWLALQFSKIDLILVICWQLIIIAYITIAINLDVKRGINLYKYFAQHGKTFIDVRIISIDSDGSLVFSYENFWFRGLKRSIHYRGRLFGITTPSELSEPTESLADYREYLKILTAHRTISLELCYIAKRTRFYVIVHAGDMIVNLEMLRGGYARLCKACLWSFPEYRNVFENSELMAKKQHCGIWKTSKFGDCAKQTIPCWGKVDK